MAPVIFSWAKPVHRLDVERGLKHRWFMPGTQVLHRRLFDGCPGGPFSVNLVWDEAIADARLKAIVHDDDWYHVGTPETVGPTGRALSLGRKPSNPH